MGFSRSIVMIFKGVRTIEGVSFASFMREISAMAFSATTDIFSDAIVTAKELNRQPGRILDLALEGPVTITRNHEAFALLPRENVTSLIQTAKVAGLAFEVTSIAFRVMEGETLPKGHLYAWMMEFDRDELKDFVESVTSTFHQFAGQTNAWDEVDAVVYEWHESALVIESGVLDDLLNQ
jgi:hypothetical protein